MFTYDYVTAILTNLMVCTFGQMLFCAIPVLITNKGYDASYAGLMVYAFSFASVLFRPFTGWLASSLPGRKTVCTCLIIFIASCLLLWTTPPLWLSVSIRVIQGIVMCVYGTIFGALVASIVLPERFDEGTGYYSIGVPAMSFFGPALGLLLIHHIGEKGMFLLLAVWMSIAAIVCGNIKSGDNPVSPPLRKGERNIFKISFAKGAVFHSAILAAVFISHSSLVSFLSLYAQQQGLGSMTPFYLTAGICIIGVRLLFTLRRGTVQSERFMLPSMAALGLCMLALRIISRSLLLPLAAVYGCAMGIVQPGLIALALSSCPSGRKTAATATYYLGLDVGTGVGGLLWGAVANTAGYRMIFVLSSVVNLIAFVVMLLRGLIFRKKRSDLTQPS